MLPFRFRTPGITANAPVVVIGKPSPRGYREAIANGVFAVALIVVVVVATAAAQAAVAPEKPDIVAARLAHFRVLHGSVDANAICHGVGEIVSTKKISRNRYSVRYDEVMYYNDPRLPHPNIKSIVVEKVEGRWIWVNGDEPTCENFVL